MTPAPDLAALTKLAQKLAPGGESVAEVKPLSGGASQELWAVVVETPSGAEKVVLRRAPAGRVRSELSTSIELEAELIKSAGKSAPPMAMFDTDTNQCLDFKEYMNAVDYMLQHKHK